MPDGLAEKLSGEFRHALSMQASFLLDALAGMVLRTKVLPGLSRASFEEHLSSVLKVGRLTSSRQSIRSNRHLYLLSFFA